MDEQKIEEDAEQKIKNDLVAYLQGYGSDEYGGPVGAACSLLKMVFDDLAGDTEDEEDRNGLEFVANYFDSFQRTPEYGNLTIS